MGDRVKSLLYIKEDTTKGVDIVKFQENVVESRSGKVIEEKPKLGLREKVRGIEMMKDYAEYVLF